MRGDLLQVAWGNTVTEHLNPLVLGALHICALVTSPTEAVLTAEDLSAFDQAYKDLEEAVNALSRDDPLVAILLEQLSQMKQARGDYDIVGAEALRRSTYELDGSLQTNVGLREDGTFMRGSPRLDDRQRLAVERALRLSAIGRRLVAGAVTLGVIGGAVKFPAEALEGARAIASISRVVTKALGSGETVDSSQPPNAEQDSELEH